MRKSLLFERIRLSCISLASVVVSITHSYKQKQRHLPGSFFPVSLLVTRSFPFSLRSALSPPHQSPCSFLTLSVLSALLSPRPPMTGNCLSPLCLCAVAVCCGSFCGISHAFPGLTYITDKVNGDCMSLTVVTNAMKCLLPLSPTISKQ